MYCMDFLQAIRLHNESVQMIHDSQMQMIRTIDRMNERLYRVLEELPIEESREEQPRESSTRSASRRTQRSQRSQRTSTERPPVSSSSRTPARTSARHSVRNNTGEQVNPHGTIHRPRRQESTHPVNSLNSIASLFRNGFTNGLSNGTNRNGYIQYYWFPVNTVQQNLGNMESVPIPVSEEVISTACRVYSYEQDGSGNSTECPIDLSPFQQGDEIMEIRQCGHRFRSSNLRRWFQTNPRCPLCRVDVRDISNEIDLSGIDLSGNVQEENGEEQEPSTLPNLADTTNLLSTPTQSQSSQSSQSIFRAPTTDSFRSASTITHTPFTTNPSMRNHINLFDSSGNISNTHTLESLLTTTLEDLFTSAFQEPENESGMNQE